MGKKNIHITIDEDIHKLAIEKGLNVSGIADRALYEKVIGKEVVIQEALKCAFCGRVGEQGTFNSLNERSTNLVWLYPDERWICNSCLKSKSRLL